MKADRDEYFPVFANDPPKTVLPRSGYDGFSVTVQPEDRNHCRSFSWESLTQGTCSWVMQDLRSQIGVVDAPRRLLAKAGICAHS